MFESQNNCFIIVSIVSCLDLDFSWNLAILIHGEKSKNSIHFGSSDVYEKEGWINYLLRGMTAW